MKKIIYFFLITLFLTSCVTKKNTYSRVDYNKSSTKNVIFSGGDGSSYEKAIVVKAKNSRNGIAAEYEYLAKIYGKKEVDWQFIQQELIHKNKKPFDVLTIKHEGKKKNIYFDISSFFGKI